MNKIYTFLPLISFWLLFFSPQISAQVAFSNQNAKLGNPDHHSGVAIVVADMNNDRLDDIVRLSQGNVLNIEYQNPHPDSSFSSYTFGNVANGSQWAMAVGDVDNNGYNDVVCGDYNFSKLITANGDGTDFTLTTLPGPGFFAQGTNFADINNDGHLDIFVCNDDAESRIFGNDGTGLFGMNDDWIDMSTTPSSDNSGNYGSIWTDFDNDGDLDLYIAKCRQGVNSPTDPRRINALFVNDGNNNYTEQAEIHGLKIGWQSWTSDFQDIDNDGDLDVFITNHDYSNQLLENDGTGHFRDITESTGIESSGLPIQGVMRDFDNDGFVDILIAGNEQVFYHNNGDKTFTKVDGLFDDNDMESYAIGDLNHDGFLDIYAGYAQIYTNPSDIEDVLWMNEGNDNNFLAVDLIGTVSNRNAVGARVEIYGDWGVQIREVRAGESYGIGNSFSQHFGLGQSTTVDYVVVKWPSGRVNVVFEPQINEFITIEETICEPLQVDAAPSGSTVICSGETVEISAPEGYTYYWNNGMNTQNIMVGEEGNYSVIVEDMSGCFGISQQVTVTVDPIEIPTLTVDGDLEFCVGGSVTLTSSEANAYTWSNGANSQSIEVSESGEYFVSALGLCEEFASESIFVEVLPAPAPIVENVEIDLPGPAVLVAQGDNPKWYDAPIDGNLLAENDSLELSLVEVTTSFWVEDLVEYGQPEAFVGMLAHESGSDYNGDGYNGGIVFNVIEPIIVKSVKVYTDTPGERMIEVRNNVGDIVNSVLVDIPAAPDAGIRVDVNLEIQPGTDYLMTTNEDQNNTVLGFDSPRLKRSSTGTGVDYSDYVYDGVLEMTNSLAGTSRYYYFYDWEVMPVKTFCKSERVEAIVSVGADAIIDIEDATEIQVFPNPSNGLVNLTMDLIASDVQLQVTDLSGKKVFTKNIGDVIQKQTEELDFRNLTKGIYIIQLNTQTATYNGRIVIQ